ncbi:MAG: DUF4012 domain-containing protein, partial [Patescibacteria group bacterium]|nr:DUF4012 domain-containing protein [Patescibacteria group bacterium]
INPPQKKKFSFWPEKRWAQILIILSIVLLIILSALGVLAFYTYQRGMALKNQAMVLKTKGQESYDLFKTQDLPGAQAKLEEVKNELKTLKQTYDELSFYNKVPWLNNFYQDGVDGLEAGSHGLEAALTALKALTPYADVLGFQGEGSFSGGTAQDRINILLQTLDKISPELDKIESELVAAQTSLNKIQADSYPETFQDKPVRETIKSVQGIADQTISTFSDFRPVLEELPNIAGAKGERKKYIVLFQNDNELRPTGGFLTAYSVIYIEDGKVTPEKSDDIYELDKKFYERIEIPESLGRYLTTERYWNLRDMNISPDFKVSMDQFFENYQKVRGEPENVDGIIAVDTHVLTRLLEILGPTEVPGYGTFSAEIDKRCDCPQVVYVLSEIITKPTPYMREDRKGILGPMMQAILAKTYAAPKQKWPELFNMIWQNIQSRHVQMYFIDEQAQLATENAGAAGRIPDPETIPGDFLAIVDANLGGAKSNLFTSYKVKQTVDAPENGKLKKTIEITYTNSRQADNCNLEAGELCLNSTLLDWHRLYLPAGSKLVEAQGFTKEPKQYEELGYQVIDGFFSLEPKGVAKVIVTYTIPYELEDYQLYIWKQGGIDPYETIIDVTGGQEKVLVNKDQIYQTIF